MNPNEQFTSSDKHTPIKKNFTDKSTMTERNSTENLYAMSNR